MYAVKELQQVKLVDGTFTPSESLDVISHLINAKINFHKIHKICVFEKNANEETTNDNNCIQTLLEEKEAFKTIYKEAKAQGKKLKISGALNIEFVD